MRNFLTVLIGLFLFVVLSSNSGCEEKSENKAATRSIEQQASESKQLAFLTTQPAPDLKGFSLERENLIKRTTLWNDKNKVSYIYLINYGKVMAFYPIKGKVSSVNSLLTNPERVEKISGCRNVTTAVTSSPAEDGSYGTNGDAIFFFTTDGTYVEWCGDYMLCDKQLKLSTPPAIVYVKDAGTVK